MTAKVEHLESNSGIPGVATGGDSPGRLIDQWFPCPEVDEAVGTPMGSGRSEKALFTWFASRPIAQARAAVLCSLLPDSPNNRADIRRSVLSGDERALSRLRERIQAEYGGRSPVVLDMFSGRGIIPLEAARAGASAIGTDLSPVATLGARLLADFPLRDWSDEPPLPFAGADAEAGGEEHAGPTQRFDAFKSVEEEPRLVSDVRIVLAEVQRRVLANVGPLFRSADEMELPWAYLWGVTIPCDGCGRRFPMVGSMVLRHPYTRTRDIGQSLTLHAAGDSWIADVEDGSPTQAPTFAAAPGSRGKSARCIFADCRHVHSLDVVKAKGAAGQYEDSMLVVGEIDEETNRKIFRRPTREEFEALERVPNSPLRELIPTERIHPGNSNTIQAMVFGYQTYGSLMNDRQALHFAAIASAIRQIYKDLREVVTEDYAKALAGYCAANLPRLTRRATRGANLLAHGNRLGTAQNRCQVGDVFSSQSVLKHQFDYIEAGPGAGPGTWGSVSVSLVNALKKVMVENAVGGRPARLRRESAVALPFRDSTVDVVVTDPPYYDMITYADSSDLFHVWFRRALCDVMPDLFDGRLDGRDGLQDKSQEIIVKSKGRRTEGEHRTQDYYETMLEHSFAEARRVLKSDGHLTVIFGHSDPEAWKRLLTALTDAGFVVTSSWPSRTETAATGVATISVTVSIGARVAPAGRPVGIAAQVDAEVTTELKERCRTWDQDGLAHDDQLMASYGAALQVVGRYGKVLTPNGEVVELEHYMTLARRAVRDAIALRLDEQPLETFDPHTRLAVFWHELYGRDTVPKGEARFFAQSDELRLEDLRGPILEETRAGFRLRHDAPELLTPASSAYEVVRGMSSAQPMGTDAVAACLADADRTATDAQVWALVDWLATKLPSSDPVAISLAAVKRNIGTIQASVATQAAREKSADRLTLFEEKL
ncbi:hypothetical protein [Terrabacter carboxydivorans]|uniref:DUF1156 domain-containing protein n=1 Tax=Terrabacter carboxydivorans TaxID=619730 RepID=A0ABP5ZNL5_9MICO